MTQPKNPSAAILVTRSRRKICSRSSFAAAGAISFSANSRASSRTALSSSDNSKFMMIPSPLFLIQQGPRDDDFLDLRGPLVDAQRAHIAVKTLYRRSRDNAHPAMNLQRLVDDALRGFGGVELGHRGLLFEPLLAHILEPGCLVSQQTRSFKLGCHFRELELRRLKPRQLAAELASALAVPKRFLERAPSHPGRGCGHCAAQHIQGLQGDLETCTFPAQQVARRDAALFESNRSDRVG